MISENYNRIIPPPTAIRHPCMCGASDCRECRPTTWMNEVLADLEEEQTEPSAFEGAGS